MKLQQPGTLRQPASRLQVCAMLPTLSYAALSRPPALQTELYRHIGGRVDVPAGDIGVGVKEIGECGRPGGTGSF
jgi:hypothetical protein